MSKSKRPGTLLAVTDDSEDHDSSVQSEIWTRGGSNVTVPLDQLDERSLKQLCAECKRPGVIVSDHEHHIDDTLQEMWSRGGKNSVLVPIDQMDEKDFTSGEGRQNRPMPLLPSEDTADDEERTLSQIWTRGGNAVCKPIDQLDDDQLKSLVDEVKRPGVIVAGEDDGDVLDQMWSGGGKTSVYVPIDQLEDSVISSLAAEAKRPGLGGGNRPGKLFAPDTEDSMGPDDKVLEEVWRGDGEGTPVLVPIDMLPEATLQSLEAKV